VCLPFFVCSSGSAPSDDGHNAPPLRFERSSLSSLVATSVGGPPHPLTEREMYSILGSFAVRSRVKVLELLYHEAIRGRPSGPCKRLIVCDIKKGRLDFRKPGGRSPATSRSRSETAFHDASRIILNSWKRFGMNVISAALSYRTYPSSIYAESRLYGIREIM